MSPLTPRPGILDITPYKGGAAKPSGAQKAFKLSSNESALGPSPKAMEAYGKASRDLHIYPDGSARALRDAIADCYDLDAERIVCGAGSDELLQLLTQGYVGEGDNIIQTRHGFLVYALAAKAVGAQARFADEADLTADVDALLAKVDERTRIVFIANPNNPTGTYIPEHEICRLREGLRDDILLVIDAAYAEYMDASDYNAGESLVDACDNVVMTRTFSKIYGLGGLRLGWAYCPAAVADVLNRIRGPFNVSAPAIAAGVAAIQDTEFVERNRAHNTAERERVAMGLTAAGLTVVPSVANFVLVKFPEDGVRNADYILRYLEAGGVMVREMGGYGLPEYLRISIGEATANDQLLHLLNEKFR